MKESESEKDINSTGADIQEESSLREDLLKNVFERTQVNSNMENNEGQTEKEELLVGNNINTVINQILDRIQNCSAVLKSQQIGEPELSVSDKRSLAENLLLKNPSNFLTRFGLHLNENHLKYFYSLNNPEVTEHANQVGIALKSDKKLEQKNRRYEALKRLEAEGSYFSEAEMEKREPLLYHQLVGQFLTEKEKIIKNRQNNSNMIPTFSNFLIQKMERDEITALRKSQQETEDNDDDDEEEEMSEEDNQIKSLEQNDPPRWGDDWIDAENSQNQKRKKKKQQQKKKKRVHLSVKEKALLLEEFKSLMHSRFLSGLDAEFNYDDVDLNPEYDSLETKSQDAEDKYFDEESCGGNICTDTGIEDY